MHEPDTAVVLLLSRDIRVEEEQCVLDGPVAEEVEDI